MKCISICFAFIIFFVSYSWDVNVTECKWLMGWFGSQLTYCTPTDVSYQYYQTITSQQITEAQTPKAFCVLLNVISSEEGNFKAERLIFVFFLSSWQSYCFYLLLIFTQVACLCHNAIALCSFHIGYVSMEILVL